MEWLYALIFLAVMGGAYAVLYTLNHRTAVPEGCEDLKVDCEGCRITSCGSHPTHHDNEGEVKND